jgi:hypothetical protein
LGGLLLGWLYNQLVGQLVVASRFGRLVYLFARLFVCLFVGQWVVVV